MLHICKDLTIVYAPYDLQTPRFMFRPSWWKFIYTYRFYEFIWNRLQNILFSVFVSRKSEN